MAAATASRKRTAEGVHAVSRRAYGLPAFPYLENTTKDPRRYPDLQSVTGVYTFNRDAKQHVNYVDASLWITGLRFAPGTTVSAAAEQLLGALETAGIRNDILDHQIYIARKPGSVDLAGSAAQLTFKDYAQFVSFVKEESDFCFDIYSSEGGTASGRPLAFLNPGESIISGVDKRYVVLQVESTAFIGKDKNVVSYVIMAAAQAAYLEYSNYINRNNSSVQGQQLKTAAYALQHYPGHIRVQAAAGLAWVPFCTPPFAEQLLEMGSLHLQTHIGPVTLKFSRAQPAPGAARYVIVPDRGVRTLLQRLRNINRSTVFSFDCQSELLLTEKEREAIINLFQDTLNVTLPAPSQQQNMQQHFHPSTKRGQQRCTTILKVALPSAEVRQQLLDKVPPSLVAANDFWLPVELPLREIKQQRKQKKKQQAQRQSQPAEDVVMEPTELSPLSKLKATIAKAQAAAY